MGLPVPAGFTISTDVCLQFEEARQFPGALDADLRDAMRRIETATPGRTFGAARAALLVSVRSGARVSMPGMMDTVLAIGLTDVSVASLATECGERFAYDTYRRLIAMYGDVVHGIKSGSDCDDPWQRELSRLRALEGVADDGELSAAALRQCVATYKRVFAERAGEAFPQDAWVQLRAAIAAVFGSWSNARAVQYRELNRIPHDWGTACTVQAMVFGNADGRSATGVAFTRDPATGERGLIGEYLRCACGEDVVSGVRTPQAINGASASRGLPTMEHEFPGCFAQLVEHQQRLEQHFRDMQDVEFTVQSDTLYVLQTRAGKRTNRAAFRMARDMVAEGLIGKAEAIGRLDADGASQFLAEGFDPADLERARAGCAVAHGLPAGPGAACGVATFDSSTALARAAAGQAVVLVRRETSPDDIGGISATVALLTARGGMTSHCALVARQMNKVAVVGAAAVRVDLERRLFVGADGRVVRDGEWLAVDGAACVAYAGRIATHASEVMQLFDGTRTHSADYALLCDVLAWCDEASRVRVRVNADTESMVRQGMFFGACGVGLTRTEHMLYASERIDVMREMILAADAAARAGALARLLPMQRGDFAAIFRAAAAGAPVTVRLLDPPLHEFLPAAGSPQVLALAARLGTTPAAIDLRISELAEHNPMLGHRGCRVGITAPDITAMQVRALIEAAIDVGGRVQLEIMVPLVAFESELRHQIGLVRAVAEDVMRERGAIVNFKVGTMIETPRAALIAATLARTSDFFSFGTNDLTQATLLVSRDDAFSFIPAYIAAHLIADDPFRTLDREGVGQLMRMAAADGKRANPLLSIGVCGEHGGDPRSIALCHEFGVDYVSCSPARVPVARIAAAQAALKDKKYGMTT
jgi:pyruvate,orthophosphate dikinase